MTKGGTARQADTKKALISGVALAGATLAFVFTAGNAGNAATPGANPVMLAVGGLLVTVGLVLGIPEAKKPFQKIRRRKTEKRETLAWINKAVPVLPGRFQYNATTAHHLNEALSALSLTYPESTIAPASRTLQNASAHLARARRIHGNMTNPKRSMASLRAYRSVIEEILRSMESAEMDFELAGKEIWQVKVWHERIAANSDKVSAHLEGVSFDFLSLARKVEDLEDRFDAPFLVDVFRAKELAEYAFSCADDSLIKCWGYLQQGELQQAEAALKNARKGMEDFSPLFVVMKRELAKAGDYASVRDAMVANFQTIIEAESDENKHPSIVVMIPRVKSALSRCSAINCTAGNPAVTVENALAPVYEYQRQVAALVELKLIVNAVDKDIVVLLDHAKASYAELKREMAQYGISAKTNSEWELLMGAEALVNEVFGNVVKDASATGPWDLAEIKELHTRAITVIELLLTYTSGFTILVNDAATAEKRRKTEEERRKKRKKQQAKRRQNSSSSYSGGYSVGFDGF